MEGVGWALDKHICIYNSIIWRGWEGIRQAHIIYNSIIWRGWDGH